MRKIRYKEASKELIDLVSPDIGRKSRVSVGMESFVQEYYFLDIEKVIPYKNQTRKTFNQEEIEQLAETIKEYGVLQPLSVIESEESGCFEVISGERRLRAAKIAGINKIPCIIIQEKEVSDERALIENLQRADLNPLELAQGLKIIVNKNKNIRRTKLAQKLGLKDSFISETLKLLELPEEIQDYILKEDIRNRDLFRQVFKEPKISKQLELLKEHSKKPKTHHRRNDFSYRSILRLSYRDGEIKIQKSYLHKLEITERRKVKEVLLEIAQTL